MKNKYYAVANTNEKGLKKNSKYIVESVSLGIVDVYDLQENYITSTRLDNFDDYQPIK